LAVLEELSGVRTEVTDPVLDFIKLQQPGTINTDFQKRQVDAMARRLLSE